MAEIVDHLDTLLDKAADETEIPREALETIKAIAARDYAGGCLYVRSRKHAIQAALKQRLKDLESQKKQSVRSLARQLGVSVFQVMRDYAHLSKMLDMDAPTLTPGGTSTIRASRR